MHNNVFDDIPKIPEKHFTGQRPGQGVTSPKKPRDVCESVPAVFHIRHSCPTQLQSYANTLTLRANTLPSAVG